MVDMRGLAGKEVLVKIVGREYPIRTTIMDFASAGAWIHDDSLRITLVSQTPLKGMPKYLEPSPLLFLPFSQIEWLLANPADVKNV